jgi:hypothetical protein
VRLRHARLVDRLPTQLPTVVPASKALIAIQSQEAIKPSRVLRAARAASAFLGGCVRLFL